MAQYPIFSLMQRIIAIRVTSLRNDTGMQPRLSCLALSDTSAFAHLHLLHASRSQGLCGRRAAALDCSLRDITDCLIIEDDMHKMGSSIVRHALHYTRSVIRTPA